MIMSSLSIVAFLAVVLTPVFVSERKEWSSFADVKYVLFLSWPAIIGGLWLRYSERFSSNTVYRNSLNEEWKTSHIVMSKIFHEIESTPESDCYKAIQPKIRAMRQQILQCAVGAVRHQLQLPHSCTLVATVCDYAGPDLDKAPTKYLYVSARSTPHTRGKAEDRHRRDQMVANNAIERFDIAHAHDTWIPTGRKARRAPGKRGCWPRLSKRHYRSIVAIPIESKGCVWGALCVDASWPFVFSGKTEVVNILLQPYASALARTYPIGVYSKSVQH